MTRIYIGRYGKALSKLAKAWKDDVKQQIYLREREQIYQHYVKVCKESNLEIPSPTILSGE